MPPRAGPFDKRTNVWRCAACQRRKIKCVGSTPCEYCKKTRQICHRDTAPKSTALVFVPSRHLAPTSQVQLKAAPRPDPRPVILNTGNDRDIAYFFDDFLKTNDFSAKWWARVTPNLHNLLHSSPALRDVITAVAVLDASRRPTRCSPPGGPLELHKKALRIYSRSLVTLKSTLDAKGVAEDTIWTTFFLGLFELMIGNNPENWDRHFLYGTCKLLQICGPESFRKGTGRELFLTLRLFEASRSLIYDEPSFLREPTWFSLMVAIREELGDDGRLQEAALDVMLQCSDLCARLLKRAPDCSLNLEDILEEGERIRLMIDIILQDTREPDPSSPDDLVASVFLHATSIYLSGIFDYRLHLFSALPAAIIPRNRVQSHVAYILKGTNIACMQTKLCGLLFLYPLRVAAARAAEPSEQKQIMETFEYIRQQGFAIVQVFQAEIKEVWRERY